MQKLNQEEVSTLKLKQRVGNSEAKGKPIYQALSELLVGQALMLTKDEWPYKSDPSNSMVPKWARPTPEAKYSVRRLEDGNGFVYIRVA